MIYCRHDPPPLHIKVVAHLGQEVLDDRHFADLTAARLEDSDLDLNPSRDFRVWRDRIARGVRPGIVNRWAALAGGEKGRLRIASP